MSSEIEAGDWVQVRSSGQVGKVDEIRDGWLWWGDDPEPGKRWPIPVVQLLGRRRRTMAPVGDLIKLR